MSDVSPERVLRALRKNPDLLSGVLDKIVAEGLLTPPKPLPATEVKLATHPVPIELAEESEVVVMTVPDDFPPGYYFVRVVGVIGSSPQGRFSLYSRNGLEARQVPLVRTHLEREVFLGVVGFSDPVVSDRILAVRGTPFVDGIPMELFPLGGTVTIQWIGPVP